MHLVGSIPEMIYGFHGSAASKQPYLSAAYASADMKGELSNRKKGFYLIDITYRSPESFSDQESLYGQLPVRLLASTPFIVAKRLSSETAFDLGHVWMECAKEKHGLRKVKGTDVDWTSPSSFMLAFPDVVDLVFEKFPKLRCMLMPMRTKLLPEGENICLVGVAPKARSAKAEASVRLKPLIKVNLKPA